MTPTGDGSPPECYTAMWGPHPLRMHKVTPAGDGSLPICSIARRNSRPLRKLVPHHGPHCFSSGRPMANMGRCLHLMDREGANTPLKFGDKTSSVALCATRMPCCSRYRVTRCTGCAPYAHMTPGFKDAHGDAHPMDSQGTSKSHPPPPEGPRPETTITWTSTQNIPKWTSMQRTRLGWFPRPPLPPPVHSPCELYYKMWWIQNGHASSSILRCTSPRCARLRWGRMPIYMCTSVHATYNTS